MVEAGWLIDLLVRFLASTLCYLPFIQNYAAFLLYQCNAVNLLIFVHNPCYMIPIDFLTYAALQPLRSSSSLHFSILRSFSFRMDDIAFSITTLKLWNKSSWSHHYSPFNLFSLPSLLIKKSLLLLYSLNLSLYSRSSLYISIS